MTQRRFILLFGAYLIATALAAWLAFILGASRGAGAVPAIPDAEPGAAAYVDMSETAWSCDQFRGFPGLRANHRERVCGPGGAGGPVVPARHAGANGPLQQAVIMKIAGGGPLTLARLDVPGSASVAHPDSIFDRPAEPLGGLIAVAGGPTGTAPGGGPFPGQPLVLSSGPFQNPEIPPPEVTPIPLPGGLALMAAGLAGLAAAARRRVRR